MSPQIEYCGDVTPTSPRDLQEDKSMHIRKASWLNLAVIGLFTAATTTVIVSAPLLPVLQDDGNTEDIVYMANGRILHGQILEETRDTIVFEYRNDKLGITTKMVLKKQNISKMDQDVAMATSSVQPDAVAENKPKFDSNSTSTVKPGYLDELKNKYEARLASEDLNLPRVYMVPMEGQMGTDVHISFYRSIVDDIRAMNPDLIVFHLDCSDIDDGMMMNQGFRIAMGELELEPGIQDLDQYGLLIDLFRDDLRDIPQIMWVKDSVGVSSVVALAWPDFYMHPDATLAGLDKIWAQAAEFGDDQVSAKMIAAWSAAAKAFLEYGGVPLVIGDAMLDPSKTLMASWRGRDVIWSLDGQGVYMVDGSETATARFTARVAENLCLTRGSAETLDDLMLLHGYREYQLLPGAADSEYKDYVKNWRRSFEGATTALEDYQQHMSWATGNDTLRYLGRAKSDLAKVLSAIKHYDAVKVRFEQIGLSEYRLQTLIMSLKERIKILRQNDRGGGGADGPPGRGAGGGGPGRGR
ncbi:MAG: hypothetical protein O7G85_03255 [Planctomycetota bacterium]|nr:hypothetical protein [Planctomycetota bacterium]